MPERTFQRIAELDREDNYSLDEKRIKIISQTGNGLFGMGTIEPALVNPQTGISSHSKELFGKAPCLIGRIESIQNCFWLFELNNNRKLVRDKNMDYVFFEYVGQKRFRKKMN